MAMAMISGLCVLLASCISAAMAMGGASAGGSDCSGVVYEMMPCVDYTSVGSTKAKASKGCCKVVEDAMKIDSQCLCVAVKESGAMGVELNLTRAIGLPLACGISTPLPHCGIALPPGMALAPVPNAQAPSRTAPTLAPTMAPTLAPVNPLAPAIPRRRMPPSSAPVPSNGPTTGAAPSSGPTAGAAPSNGPTMIPLGPNSGVMAPAPGQSDASSLAISSGLVVPVLFTLLVLFRPL